jgi:hypothetical protein
MAESRGVGARGVDRQGRGHTILVRARGVTRLGRVRGWLGRVVQVMDQLVHQLVAMLFIT